MSDARTRATELAEAVLRIDVAISARIGNVGGFVAEWALDWHEKIPVDPMFLLLDPGMPASNPLRSRLKVAELIRLHAAPPVTRGWRPEGWPGGRRGARTGGDA